MLSESQGQNYKYRTRRTASPDPDPDSWETSHVGRKSDVSLKVCLRCQDNEYLVTAWKKCTCQLKYSLAKHFFSLLAMC